MRTSAIFGLILLAAAGRPAVAGAQVADHPAAKQQASARPATSDIDRWLTEPTAITLNADQRKRVDSLRGAYVAETRKLSKGGGGDMQIVLKMSAVRTKYVDAVRAILRPDQQTVFDKNVSLDTLK